MLRLQKVLQVKTHMRSMLESSRLRLLKEFGAENKALEHVRDAWIIYLLFCACSSLHAYCFFIACFVVYFFTLQYLLLFFMFDLIMFSSFAAQ